MIIFHTPPPFYLCTPPAAPFECITMPGPIQSRSVLSQVSAVVFTTLSLRCSSCAYICFWPQRDLLLHVDWGGRQQEVWVLQAPAGKPLFISLFAPRWAPVCCDRRFYLNTRCSFLWRCWCDRVLCPKRKEIAKNNNNVKNKTWKTKLGVKRLKK